MELRDRDAGLTWLTAGLCLTRIVQPTPATLEQSGTWLLAALVEHPSIPPPAVVCDIGQLLLGAQLSFDGGSSPPHERLKKALRQYEDHVLGRLAADHRLDAVSDAIARLAAPLRPAALALFLTELLQRIGYTEGTQVPPGVARALTEEPPTELLQQGMLHLRTGGSLLDQLAASYEALVAAARSTGTLVPPSAVFALENLTVLAGLAQRVAVRQVLEVAERLENALPTTVKRRPRSAGHTPTRISDESAYPVGGFAAISNAGSFENLVSSELIYMEPKGDDAIDMFMVRWAEGELLYYTRDESVWVRDRRLISFVFLPDLTQARFKDPTLHYQRLVLLLGAVVAWVRRLETWLGRSDLQLRMLFVSEGDVDPLAEERGLLSLLLREWQEKGLVQLECASDPGAVLARVAEDRLTAQTDVIWLGQEPARPPSDPRIRHIGFSLPDGWPTVQLDTGEQVAPRDHRWEAWQEASCALVTGIL